MEHMIIMDTVPSPRSITSALPQIEAQSMCLVVERLEQEEKGKMIMHIENLHIKG
ncbi:hypothetical protein DPMN_101105 [Dreissena polymorpha]|uniref:Uncharacterized protein n=1 Tax=Dreissena polymorpha TaxID=45954 RepID=A0A9D4R813_DREPO|nr:hypothetical protein DPMN_101105 [Dreissena polymorpha]